MPTPQTTSNPHIAIPMNYNTNNKYNNNNNKNYNYNNNSDSDYSDSDSDDYEEEPISQQRGFFGSIFSELPIIGLLYTKKLQKGKEVVV